MAMKYFAQITGKKLPAMDTGDVAAFLEDFAISEDADKPITSGLFPLEKGESLVYTYTYHEMKFIVDGSFQIEDETGQKVTATAGDMFYFPQRLHHHFFDSRLWCWLFLWTTRRR